MSRELLEKARMLGEVGRGDQARAVLRSYLASEPEDAEAWRLIAALEIDRGEHAAALLTAARAVALDPEDEWGHRLHSVALQEVGRTDEAVAAAGEAVRLVPWAAAGHERMASALVARAGRLGAFPTLNLARRRRLKEAQRSAERAVELAPRSAASFFALGYVHQAAGRHRPAVRAYQRTLALDPRHAAAHNNLGALRLSTFDITRTLRSLRASLELNPQGREAQANFEMLAARALWVGWLLISVGNAALLWLSFVADWPVRAFATLAVLLGAGLAARHFFGMLTGNQVKHLARRLTRRWGTWIFGPLLVFGLLTTIGFLVLPTPAARTAGMVYVGEALAGVRLAWLGAVVAVVVRWARRK